MDIEEERMAFEGYVLSLSKYKKRSPKFIFDLDENGDYDNQDIYELHHAWQASVSREGFVLIKNDPKTIVAIEQMVEQQVEASGITQDVFRLDGERILEAMLSAQEQSNESN